MAFHKKTIRDIDIRGKRIIVRVDYNVPVNDRGQVEDDLRIQGSLPTLQYLLDRDCRLVLMSHLGRPEGRPDPHYSLRDVARQLARILDQKVTFVEDCLAPIDPKARIVLLENLRFHPEEEANDSDFAKKLAMGGEVYVDDAFGVVHHPGASLVAITKFLPSVAGLLLEREVDTITEAMEHPAKPLVAILGGAKIADKIELIDAFINKAQKILIAGAMANTFYAAQGIEVGKSKYEKSDVGSAKRIMDMAEKHQVELHLPDIDVVVATEISDNVIARTVRLSQVDKNDIILDIGPQSLAKFEQALTGAKTVIWNGTLGVTEVGHFAVGSKRLAHYLAAMPQATTIIGGGDTAGFIHQIKMLGSFSHVSTGGGASLELMAGKKLPGVEALLDKA